MTKKDLVFKLHIISEKSELMAVISEFINTHSTKQDGNILKIIEKFSDEEFEILGNNLGYFRNYCTVEINKEENSSDKNYIAKLEEVSVLLGEISALYQQNNKSRQKAKMRSNEEEAISQQKNVLKEINDHIKNFREEIIQSKIDISNINNSFNEKIFNVLINTVGILGIFVSIAFAGFGISAIFSNLDFATALKSEEAFVKNVFYLFLTGWLCYNLLLVLINFIYRLSRPIDDGNIITANVFRRINSFKPLNLTSFLWIDGAWGFLVLGLFVCSLIFW